MEQDNQLQQQYKHLQQDWNSYKRSNPHPSHRRSTVGRKSGGPPDILHLMDTSPRELVSSLQQDHSPSNGWKVRTNNLAVEEIVMDRRTAIFTGKLKGKRLFDGSDGSDKEEICSDGASASVLIQGSEVGPTSSYSSSSAFDDDDDEGDCCSSCCVCRRNVEMERQKVVIEDEKVGGVDDGGKWMARMSWLGLVLMVFALGIISWKGFVGEEESGDWLIPT